MGQEPAFGKDSAVHTPFLPVLSAQRSLLESLAPSPQSQHRLYLENVLIAPKALPASGPRKEGPCLPTPETLPDSPKYREAQRPGS